MQMLLTSLPLAIALAAGPDTLGPERCYQWSLTIENKLSYSVEVSEPGVRAHGAVVPGSKRTIEMEEGRVEPQVEFRHMGRVLGYGLPESGLVLAEGEVKKKLRLEFACAAQEKPDA